MHNQQQQQQQQEFRQVHSSGSASRHVQQQRQQQRMQQEGRYNYSADGSGSGSGSGRSSTSDMLSHREEVYGRPDVNSRGKRISGDGGGSPPINSRQFHRVSMLSPSREQQQQRQKRAGVRGRFNIISGEFEAE
mmetsp:Transcript_4069/g.7434  ORF Transcript_4069/g.7434 Transcript_4069/m.7434 type:complete len:134 (-) Transcript_4069:298-699(-)